ncbi:urease subunit gamma [Actinocrinis puniceicyclus]|uniref:urease n=1 Tax=Actinocrinis puniceicyclus TaxID=977794 RepID=A0A8J7WNQ8_9ACTN|nr:urease subunit gamma [Actinocrinis puniceicyclus]MBS2963092.1 urease subunit gamma [Actinocrinis puniceicyclus]
MRLTPTERDRLLLYSAAQLARDRRARGLLLNVPEAVALIADTVCEAARDGLRLSEAIEAGRSVLSAAEVLPGVPDIVTEVQVEAVFDDGTRLAVISEPFAGAGSLGGRAPGAILLREERNGAAHAGERAYRDRDGHADGHDHDHDGHGDGHGDAAGTHPAATLTVRNTGDVPISVTSHFHFFEVNRRLAFDRAAAYGLRLDIPAGSSVRFEPGTEVRVALVPIGGARIAIGFSGLVDGPLDAPGARAAAIARAEAEGYAMELPAEDGAR